MKKGQPKKDPRPELWKLARDVLVCTLGIFMLVHETITDRPSELIVGAALLILGIPVVLRLDEARRNGNGQG